MRVYSVEHLNGLIVQYMHKIRKLPFDVVVHLPRSGTLPASLIATYLRKPFASVDEYCQGIINTRKAEFERLDRILLVDDSVRTGVQMAEAIARIRKHHPNCKIITFTVYLTKSGKKPRVLQPTLYLYEHEDKHYIFPWFMWKTKKLAQCAVDMYGVLCRDCLPKEDDDGPEYLKFLENADPKFNSNFPIGYIVTGRLEKYREQTERWLEKHGVVYGQLIMGPWPDIQSRKKVSVGSWKASIYRNLPSSLFIESSVREAKCINQESGKNVWCIDNQQYYGS
jgi:orotate phosphoribosyltransferase